MKKIFPSFLIIALIICSVTSLAYTLFSSQANVSGLTFSTGNADLQISSDSLNWGNTLTLAPSYTNMMPGFSNSQVFFLKNNSLSNINLKIFNKLIDNNGTANSLAWSIIGDKINVAFQKYNGSAWVDINSNSLAQWKENAFDIDNLSVGATQKYQMTVTLVGIGNTDAGQTISDLSFQLTGTQQ